MPTVVWVFTDLDLLLQGSMQQVGLGLTLWWQDPATEDEG